MKMEIGKIASILMSEADLGKVARGLVIEDLFHWDKVGCLRFDKETGEILINENILMQIIQIANPFQEPRKLRVVPQDEWLGK